MIYIFTLFHNFLSAQNFSSNFLKIPMTSFRKTIRAIIRNIFAPSKKAMLSQKLTFAAISISNSSRSGRRDQCNQSAIYIYPPFSVRCAITRKHTRSTVFYHPSSFRFCARNHHSSRASINHLSQKQIDRI